MLLKKIVLGFCIDEQVDRNLLVDLSDTVSHYELFILSS